MDGNLALEGAFLIERGAAVGLEFEALYCVPAREAWARGLALAGLEPKVIPESDIADIAGYPFHRGAYALARRPRSRGLSEILSLAPDSSPCKLLVLPELVDLENLGSAFRNAAALGCSALLLGPTGPDPFSRRVLRVSMGASLSLPWARLAGPGELRELEARAFRTAACVLDPGAIDLRDWEVPPRLALLLGNEAFGLSEAWLGACRERVILPMQNGADSLNVATAAAIFLYATNQGRRPADALSL